MEKTQTSRCLWTSTMASLHVQGHKLCNKPTMLNWKPTKQSFWPNIFKWKPTSQPFDQENLAILPQTSHFDGENPVISELQHWQTPALGPSAGRFCKLEPVLRIFRCAPWATASSTNIFAYSRVHTPIYTHTREHLYAYICVYLCICFFVNTCELYTL